MNLYNIEEGKILNDEIVNIFHEDKIIRIEKVIMFNKKSPEDFWYNVPENEFGVIIDGFLEIEYKDGTRQSYKKGEKFYIGANIVHRLNFTSEICIVLCVFEKNS